MRNPTHAGHLLTPPQTLFLYPPQTLFVVGILFSRCPCVRLCTRASVCPSVRPSVTLCFLNIFKSHCWIFIKPCKHVHICKTNTLNKKVRARDQFYSCWTFIIPPRKLCFYTPGKLCLWWVYCFHVVRACVRLCVRASVCPSVTLCFLNIFKSHCWIFIKPCKHVHICKTNTLNKKVRARGQFY